MTCLQTFSCASVSFMYCICLDVLVDQNDYFDFGFMMLNWKVCSYLYNTWIIIIAIVLVHLA